MSVQRPHAKASRTVIQYDPNRKKTISKKLRDYLKTPAARYDYSNFERKPLPFIRTEEEYYRRLEVYEEGKETRNTIFFHKTRESWLMARKMYYMAVRQIYFLSEGIEKIKQVVPSYNDSNHVSNMKKLLISLRKIAKCCYEIGHYIEGYEICLFIIKTIKSQKLPERYAYLTYGVIACILAEKEVLLHLSLQALDEGLRLKDSPLLTDMRISYQVRADSLIEERKKKEDEDEVSRFRYLHQENVEQEYTNKLVVKTLNDKLEYTTKVTLLKGLIF